MSADPIVLSPQQERLWRLSQATDGGPFRTTVQLVVTGADAVAVRAALRNVFDAHPVLRLRLARHPAFEMPRPTHVAVDLALANAAVTAEGARVRVALALPAFALDAEGAGPLAAALAARLAGEPEADPPAPFALVAEWARETLEAEELAMARAAWRERVSELRLAATRGGVGALPHFPFAPASLRRRTPELVRAFLATLDGGSLDDEAGAGLLAAWAVVARRRLGLGALPIGLRLAGRGEPELARVIGPLARIAPVRLPGGVARPLGGLVAEARMALFEADAWQEGFSWGTEAEAGSAPLFAPVAFARPAPLASVGTGPVTVSVVRVRTVEDRFLYRLSEEDGDLVLDYDTAAVPQTAAERVLDGLLAFLEASRADPEAPCAMLPVVGPAERERLAAAWRGAQADDSPSPLAAFRRQVALAPDRVAVLEPGGEAVTYGRLARRVEALAGALAAAGTGRERIVAIRLAPGADFAAALLATMRAGAAFAPLEPSHPPARHAALIASLSPVAIVLDAAPEPETAEACRAVGAAILTPDATGEETAPMPPVDGRLLVYALFTSGSTGAPRCVGVPAAALANQIAWLVRRFAIGPGDRVFARTSPTFDASLWETLAPLAAGATIVVAPGGARFDADALAIAVLQAQPTRLQIVPNLLARLLDARPDALDRVETLFCGGEVLGAELAQRAAARGPRVVNLYGPTECCIQIAAHEGALPHASEGALPVGAAIPGTGLGVIEACGALAATGAVGEVVVRGVCLARGYLNAPADTARAFAPDGLGDPTGARLYRTGDLGALDVDGVLVVLGRADTQVKIRGARVEPAEAAALVCSIPGIRDCAVVAEPTSAGGACLVAIVVLEPGREAELEARLPAEAARLMPDYMVPARFVPAPELPRLASGKLDPGRLARLAGRRVYAAPATLTERLVAEIWREVLRLERVGRHDSFFELGGHSILLLRVLSRLRAAFGRETPLAEIHHARDVADLARRIDALAEGRVPIVPQGAGVDD